MSTVEELQKQLNELKQRNHEEMLREDAELKKMGDEVSELQDAVYTLEKEKAELTRHYGPPSDNKDSDKGGFMSMLGNMFVAIVDVDEKRCKKL
ncbi:hypothetical protein ERJ75_000989500 [Trypanosoma vivax]|uniref:Uncharacterized protein n=1 Tax=Trypanosoma vivax (strain Y486) TaxID=1055687 RepID=G0U710_TRYVY|nr:hypothetical protein ERJ75_000989500 [Trypanosoma vivax]CCC51667.1 conserved hypothetical protein [Trypanosoma vivax Y486]